MQWKENVPGVSQTSPVHCGGHSHSFVSRLQFPRTHTGSQPVEIETKFAKIMYELGAIFLDDAMMIMYLDFPQLWCVWVSRVWFMRLLVTHKMSDATIYKLANFIYHTARVPMS